ncbi:hypothetical protein HK096_003834 [Nowakowskiella sp. JEL0078]|nr:hypothetical protein HK096_003834 [Nowakowskiella sp. JEL0078]
MMATSPLSATADGLTRRNSKLKKSPENDLALPLLSDDKLAKVQTELDQSDSLDTKKSLFTFSPHQERPRYVTYGLEANSYALLGLTFVASIVRLYKIATPSQVVFDEVHFGGFASKYIKGKFFMDVHPPLGKLLIAAAGTLSGFNGDFDFKEIGKDYLEPKVPYVTMRLLPGILGVLLVPIAYITMRNCGFSNISSVLASTLLIFENGFATQSRLILLDSILVFFIGLSTMMWTDFLSTQDEPFTFTWWYPLVMTGVSLGLSISVKWVGLFVIATVGFSTVMNLWELLGDVKRISWTKFAKHFLARAFCLIVIPFGIYALMFQVHFLVLVNNGTGNGFMSPEFQSTLHGNKVEDTFKEVAFGSRVIFRHSGTNGGYLHSHNLFYPTGSKQQQITCYPFRDTNNDWIIKPTLETINGTLQEVTMGPFDRVKIGDTIRIAPVSDNENHNEVSAYGAKGFLGDTNDYWRIEVPDWDGKYPYIDAMKTKFRLIHVNSGCKLFSHNVKLPEWGSGQQEVTCAKSGRHTHYQTVPTNATKVNYPKPGFWGKFFELNKKMWTVNSGLTGSHPFDSRPHQWPGLRRGISFWTDKKGGPGQVYLIGNPFIWWLGSMSCFAFVIGLLAYAVMYKRKIYVISSCKICCVVLLNSGLIKIFRLYELGFPKNDIVVHGLVLAFGSLLFDEKTALFYSILLFGALFDFATHRLTPASRSLIAVVIGIVAIWMFWQFSPLTYGTGMSKEHCEWIKWKKTWDWNCRITPETHHQEKPVPAQHVGNDEHPVKIDNSD